MNSDLRLEKLIDFFISEYENYNIEEDGSDKSSSDMINNFISKLGSVVVKSKTPDYEMMDDLEREGYKEKFSNNYKLLKLRYPKWDIEVPDFNVLPMRTIHERYEDVVRTICIYQTAMKLKVYIVGIEYYVGYQKEQAWCRGLLESQIKTIHKFDTNLVDPATMLPGDVTL